jgi:hypothetical protein
MKKFITTIISLTASILLYGCSSIDIYQIGYDSGHSIGEGEGYRDGWDAAFVMMDKRNYAAKTFNATYEQQTLTHVETFEFTKCQRDIADYSVYKSLTAGRVLAMALPSHDHKTCAIFYSRPNAPNDDRMTTLGHEFAHCLYGAFHTEEQKERDVFDESLPKMWDGVVPAFLSCDDMSNDDKERLLNAWQLAR